MNRRIRADDMDWGAVIGYALVIEVVAIGAALAVAWIMGWLA